MILTYDLALESMESKNNYNIKGEHRKGQL
jgi:hypothetical protein